MTKKPTPDYQSWMRDVRGNDVRHFRCNECGSKIKLSIAVTGCCEIGDDGKTTDENVVELRESVQDMQREIGSILTELDNLANVWGDEGMFRRCRDRLRKVLVVR